MLRRSSVMLFALLDGAASFRTTALPGVAPTVRRSCCVSLSEDLTSMATKEVSSRAAELPTQAVDDSNARSNPYAALLSGVAFGDATALLICAAATSTNSETLTTAVPLLLSWAAVAPPAGAYASASTLALALRTRPCAWTRLPSRLCAPRRAARPNASASVLAGRAPRSSRADRGLATRVLRRAEHRSGTEFLCPRDRRRGRGRGRLLNGTRVCT